MKCYVVVQHTAKINNTNNSLLMPCSTDLPRSTYPWNRQCFVLKYEQMLMVYHTLHDGIFLHEWGNMFISGLCLMIP